MGILRHGSPLCAAGERLSGCSGSGVSEDEGWLEEGRGFEEEFLKRAEKCD